MISSSGLNFFLTSSTKLGFFTMPVRQPILLWPYLCPLASNINKDQFHNNVTMKRTKKGELAHSNTSPKWTPRLIHEPNKCWSLLTIGLNWVNGKILLLGNLQTAYMIIGSQVEHHDIDQANLLISMLLF